MKPHSAYKYQNPTISLVRVTRKGIVRPENKASIPCCYKRGQGHWQKPESLHHYKRWNPPNKFRVLPDSGRTTAANRSFRFSSSCRGFAGGVGSASASTSRIARRWLMVGARSTSSAKNPVKDDHMLPIARSVFAAVGSRSCRSAPWNNRSWCQIEFTLHSSTCNPQSHLEHWKVEKDNRETGYVVSEKMHPKKTFIDPIGTQTCRDMPNDHFSCL